MSKVSLIKGDHRSQNILKALRELGDNLVNQLRSKKRVVIQPNLTSAEKQLVSTHVDALEAVVSFVSKYTDSKITIAGAAVIGKTEEAFKNFNYYRLRKKYNVSFANLHQRKCDQVEIYSRDLEPTQTKIPQIIKESDFLISLAGLRTDNSVIAAMGIKNIISCLVDRPLNHQGYKAVNLSIAKLMEEIPINLSVIDAFYGVEGASPAFGDIVEMNLALAGLDFVSVDTIGATLMGINPYTIGYLSHCKENKLGEGRLSEIEIIGNTYLEKEKKVFRLHPKHEEQLKWE